MEVDDNAGSPSQQQDHADPSRRDFIKKAAYVAPAILTLPAAPQYAKAGSVKTINNNKNKDKHTGGGHGRNDDRRHAQGNGKGKGKDKNKDKNKG
jgi:hypothetical protein